VEAVIAFKIPTLPIPNTVLQNEAGFPMPRDKKDLFVLTTSAYVGSHPKP
jgi:hypothetical protein